METLRYETAHGVYTIHRSRVQPGRPDALFLHGGPGFHNQVERRMLGPHLHPRLNVIWLDLLGCWGSPARSSEVVTLENTLADLTEIVDQVGGGRVDLVGHCCASQYVHAIRRRWPEKVRRAVFISPAESFGVVFKDIVQLWIGQQRLVLRSGEQAAVDAFLGKPEEAFGSEEVRAILRWALRTRDPFEPYWCIEAARREFFEFLAETPHTLEIFEPIQCALLREPRPDYGSLYEDVPVLLIQGDQDPVTRWAVNGTRIFEAVAGARLVSIAGAGHWPHIEKRELACRALTDFLDTA